MNIGSEVAILIVEDNPRDMEMALRALRKHNFANPVITATDGQEALDYLFGEGEWAGQDTKAAPGVIFLDLKLPKVDGMEVLSRIKSDPRTRHTPVVVITSSAEDRDRFATYAIGANSYAVKPIEFQSFLKTIADVGFYWLAVNAPSDNPAP